MTRITSLKYDVIPQRSSRSTWHPHFTKEGNRVLGRPSNFPCYSKIIKQVARLMMAITDCSSTWYDVSIGRVSPACWNSHRQRPKQETATMTAFLNIHPEEALWFFDQRGVLGKVSVHTCLNSQIMWFPRITDMRAWKRRSTFSTCRWTLSLWKWQLSKVAEVEGVPQDDCSQKAKM